ncbi:MAG: thymidine kinase [Phycisphaerae bacterium]
MREARAEQADVKDEVQTGRRGRIELICGPMFSGKSERLLDRLAEAGRRGEAAAAFKHAADDRYHPEQIVTHGGRRRAARPVASAGQIRAAVGDARLVVIDEAQFFDLDLVEACRRLAEEGRTVLVAGLDRDSWGRPFGPMPHLERIADQVTRTVGTCARCGAPAVRTQRLAPIEGPRMIGGPEAYEPRCLDCFVPPPVEPRR